MDHLPVGHLAPDFELSGVEGSAYSLSGEIGQGPVLLAFYKSACPTCQFTLPVIETLFDSFPEDHRPTIWGVSQDEAAQTADFAQRLRLHFPVLIDEHPYAVSVDYEVRYVPTLYLIDSERRIQLADFGFSKPALRTAAEVFAQQQGNPAPVLFHEGDGLPERRPG